MDEDQQIAEINALNCALMIMRGEGGGFSDDKKQNAINTLQRMFNDRVNPPQEQPQ